MTMERKRYEHLTMVIWSRGVVDEMLKVKVLNICMWHHEKGIYTDVGTSGCQYVPCVFVSKQYRARVFHYV